MKSNVECNIQSSANCVDIEKLKDWLYWEAAQLRDMGLWREAHEASYVLKYINLVERGEAQ